MVAGHNVAALELAVLVHIDLALAPELARALMLPPGLGVDVALARLVQTEPASAMDVSGSAAVILGLAWLALDAAGRGVLVIADVARVLVAHALVLHVAGLDVQLVSWAALVGALGTRDVQM